MTSDSEAIAQYSRGRDKYERTTSILHLSHPPFFAAVFSLGDLCWKRKHLEQEAESLFVNGS